MTFGEPDALDPATNYEPFGIGINEQICERLVSFDGDTTNLIGELATNWSISPDGLNYTFTLRQGAEFTDGTSFNAYIMKYSIDRTHVINDAHGPALLTIEHIHSGLDYFNFDNPNVSEAHDFLNNGSVIVLDDFTLRIVLSSPFTPFLSILNSQSMCAISPKFVINKAPSSYTDNVSDPDFGMVDLNDWFPELAGNYSKLGLNDSHPSLNSGVVPGSSTNAPSEHTGYITDNIGTGPYKLAKNITSTEIVLLKNTDWWNKDNFHPDAVNEVRIKLIDEGTTRYLELEAGAADKATLDQPQLIQVLKNSNGVFSRPFDVYRPDLYDVFPVDRLSNRAFFFDLRDIFPGSFLSESSNSNYGIGYGTENYSRLDKYNNGFEIASPNNPFTSVLFRKAFALSFDFQEFIGMVYLGLGIRMEGVIPKGMFGHDDQLIEEGFLPEYSPVLAKTLFEQVGWKGTITIIHNLGNTFSRMVAESLKSQIESYNISITILVQEFYCGWDVCYPSENDFVSPLDLVGWSADYADPHNFVTPYLHSSKGYYAMKYNYSNPVVDAMIDQAVVDPDPAVRAEFYRWIERNASLDYPMIYLNQIQFPYIVRSWITDIRGSGALNPARFSTYFATIGKPDNWEGFPLDECGALATCAEDSSSSSPTSSFFSSIPSTTFNNRLLEGLSDIFSLIFIGSIGSVSGAFSLIFIGSIGSVSGALVAILLKRMKMN
ncbi:MAG: ABC transporter substrate-binding protein [Candidatus Hodarchaeales archaeon]|jgi:peptide/nickel transport system substrate-binding protein